MAEWGNSNLLTKLHRVPPGKFQISCPAASFTQSFVVLPASLQLGPAFSSCVLGCSGLCDTHTCVCMLCVLWPRGSQIPLVGDQELFQVFWSYFTRLGQSWVNGVCDRGWRLVVPGSGFADTFPTMNHVTHLSRQLFFFLLFINDKVRRAGLIFFPFSRVESGHVHPQALWKNTAKLMITSDVQ